MDREQQRMIAAELHYEQGETMDAVARRLNVSRSTISRLLAEARESGLVQISLRRPPAQDEASKDIAERFGIDVYGVSVTDASEVERLQKVTKLAADLLVARVANTNGLKIGLAWGTTVNTLVGQLRPTPANSLIVQLNGAANPSTTGIPAAGATLTAAANAFSGSMMHFPVPAFFDHAATREAMWAERSIKHVLATQDAIDLAVFSVGAFDAPVKSRVYSAGYLSAEDVRELIADGVVGDVCTVMLRADGSHDGIELNARASGMAPERLRRVPERLCVCAGRAKAEGTLAAIRAGLVTKLVVDTELADAIAALL